MEIWLTEYNFNDAQVGYTIASSWAHGLFDAALFHLMLQDAKNSTILLHQITGNATYASLDSYTDFGDTSSNRLTAQGNAIRLLDTSAVGADSAAELIFTPNPFVQVGSRSYPALVGWRFSGHRKLDCVIINLSTQDYMVNLGDAYPNLLAQPPAFESITASNIFQLRMTTQNLDIKKGTITAPQFLIPRYGIVRLTAQNMTTNAQLLSSPTLVVAPNPSNNVIRINGVDGQGTVTIVNTLGQVVLNQSIIEPASTVDISSLPNGLFLCKIQTPTQLLTMQLSVVR